MSIILQANNISKSYGSLHVLSDLSLCFEEGSVTCICGPSGCGKTTLLRLLAGIEKPDNGTVERKKASLSYVFQEDRLSENYSVLSNVRLVTGKKMKDAEIMEHLEQLALADKAGEKVRELSGGMKRRVAIARAVCYDADIMLMDEPFKGLDAKLKTQVMDYVKRYSSGKTVIYVTHDETEREYLGGNRIELDYAHKMFS